MMKEFSLMSDNAQYFFIRFTNQSNPAHFMLLNIKKTITVRVSKPYIDSWNLEQDIY